MSEQTALEALRTLAEDAKRISATHAWLGYLVQGGTFVWAEQIICGAGTAAHYVTEVYPADKAAASPAWRLADDLYRLPDPTCMEILRLAGKLPGEPRPEVERIRGQMELLQREAAASTPGEQQAYRCEAMALALGWVLGEIFGEKVP